MVDTSNQWNKKPREMFYYRQRYKNRVFNRLASFFSHEADRRGLTKKVIADRLGKDPAQITRWLAGPGNLTMDTLSDLLYAMEAEPEPPTIVRWSERAASNYIDPLIAEIVGPLRLGENAESIGLANTPIVRSQTYSGNTKALWAAE